LVPLLYIEGYLDNKALFNKGFYKHSVT